MKDYFISQFKEERAQLTREYINAKDIWYLNTIGIEKKEIKLRMHNNKERIWKLWETGFQFSFENGRRI